MYDSDTVVLFKNDCLMERAKECFKHYRVCVNQIESDKNKYKLTKKDMATIDNRLAKSQKLIGEVVNLGQLSLSNYWDMANKNMSKKDTEILLKKVDIMTILSGVCIDLAKKFYSIDIESEVDNIRNIDQIDKLKPMFWRYVSESKLKKEDLRLFDTPMDFLYKEMSNIKRVKSRDTLDFDSLLVKSCIRSANRSQVSIVIDGINKLIEKLRGVRANVNLSKDEKRNKAEELIKFYGYKINKLKVTDANMYLLLKSIANEDSSTPMLLKILYSSHQSCFLNAFKA